MSNIKRKILSVYYKATDETVVLAPIGNAFLNSDGSIDVALHALPIDGRMIIKSAEDDDPVWHKILDMYKNANEGLGL